MRRVEPFESSLSRPRLSFRVFTYWGRKVRSSCCGVTQSKWNRARPRRRSGAETAWVGGRGKRPEGRGPHGHEPKGDIELSWSGGWIQTGVEEDVAQADMTQIAGSVLTELSMTAFFLGTGGHVYLMILSRWAFCRERKKGVFASVLGYE